MIRFVAALVIAIFVSPLFAGGEREAAVPAPAAAPAADTGSALAGKLTVAAAANLSALGEALKTAYRSRYPGVSLDFVYGASGALTTQIKNGAPFQVFMSADIGFPAQLAAGGYAAAPEKVYATGTLVLLSAEKRDFSSGLKLLTDPGIERFAIANPETAPYGKAALEALKAAGLWDSVKGKAVMGQSIAQAVQYTLSAAGIGFINKSALYTKDLTAFADKEGINWIDVDPATHEPIAQAFIVLKSAASDPAAAAFADFLSSDSVKALFMKFGYGVP